MKKSFVLTNIVAFASFVMAHGDNEGIHHQEKSILGSTDPTVLVLTLGVTSLGLILIFVSIRKYRADTN